MTLSKVIHKFAKDDAEFIAAGLAKYISHELDKEDSVIDRMPPDRDFGVTVSAVFEGPEGKKYRMHWKYLITDAVEISPRLESLASGLESAIAGEGKMKVHYSRVDKDERVPVTEEDVKSSTSVRPAQSITAADDDIDIPGFDDEAGEDVPEVDDSEFSSDIDDLSAQVDEIQDNLDDMVEDQPSIEIDNNISNHYIAECDSCHGIFISALIESDQKVDRISGTCPLCEKECDSIIKWVVKDIADDD